MDSVSVPALIHKLYQFIESREFRCDRNVDVISFCWSIWKKGRKKNTHKKDKRVNGAFGISESLLMWFVSVLRWHLKCRKYGSHSRKGHKHEIDKQATANIFSHRCSQVRPFPVLLLLLVNLKCSTCFDNLFLILMRSMRSILVCYFQINPVFSKQISIQLFFLLNFNSTTLQMSCGKHFW